ncbi:hypothetical protein D3C72_1237550 [compost metagenome]
MAAEHHGSGGTVGFLPAKRADGPFHAGAFQPGLAPGGKERQQVRRRGLLSRRIAAQHEQHPVAPGRDRPAFAQRGVAVHVGGIVEDVLRHHMLAVHPAEELGGSGQRGGVRHQFAHGHGRRLGTQRPDSGDLLGRLVDAHGLGGQLQDQRVAHGLPHRRDGWRVVGHLQAVRAIGAAHVQVDHGGAGVHAFTGALGQFVRGHRQPRVIRVGLAGAVGRHGQREGTTQGVFSHGVSQSQAGRTTRTACAKRSTILSMSAAVQMKGGANST